MSTERRRLAGGAARGGSVHAAAPAGAGDGTQAIRRATAVLKTIARATPNGATLAEISRANDLAKSTAHRILKGLIDEGLVDQAQDSLRYQMGALVYELGLTVPSSALEVARWRPVIEAVARRTGVTSYLMQRTGMEAVCVVKAEGHAVVRVIPVEVGQRRFLGVGAGATALLAALDDDTAQRYIHEIAPELTQYPQITEADLVESVRLARKHGVAISRGKVMPHSFGIGMAIPQARGTPFLAISVAAHLTSVKESDVTQWTHAIKVEMENALRAQKGGAN